MTLITIVKTKQLNNMEIILASKVPGVGCKARPHQGELSVEHSCQP